MKRTSWYHTVLGIILILGSGALLAVSFQPRWSLIGWISMLPLLVGTRLVRPGVAALLGLLAIALTGWMMVRYVSTPADGANAVFLFLGLGLMFVLVPAAASFFATRTSPALWVVFVSCTAVAAEWIINYLSPVSTALPLAHNKAALGLSGFTGIWGVTFLVWFIPGTLAMSCVRKKKAWALSIPAIAAIAVGLVASSRDINGKRMMVAAVQCEYSDQAQRETAKLPSGVEVAVWPEYTLGADSKEQYLAAEQSGAFVVASISEHTKAKKPYNAAQLISPDGEAIGHARKRHLYGDEVFCYYAGMSSKPVDMEGTKVGLAICYDTVFTDVARDLANQGAVILFVPTGDPVMPGYLTHRLHAGMVAFRAAENGIPIVWADAHGLSTIFDARGQAVAQAPVDRETSVFATVRLRSEKTLFTRAGDYFAYSSAGIAFALAVVILAKGAATRRARQDQGTTA